MLVVKFYFPGFCVLSGSFRTVNVGNEISEGPQFPGGNCILSISNDTELKKLKVNAELSLETRIVPLFYTFQKLILAVLVLRGLRCWRSLTDPLGKRMSEKFRNFDNVLTKSNYITL